MNETPEEAGSEERPPLLAGQTIPRQDPQRGRDGRRRGRDNDPRRQPTYGPAPPRQPRAVRGESGGEVSLKAIAIVAFVFGVFLHGCVALSLLEDDGTSAADLAPEIVVTATPPPAATATATVLPDRTTCEAIRGTEYRSDAERDFFRRNCITGAAPASTPSVADATG
jgi:hypothetical protein